MKTVCVTINAEIVVINLPQSDSLLMNILVEEEFLCGVNISEKNTKEEVKKILEKYKPTGKDETPISQNLRRLSIVEREEVEKQLEEWLCDGAKEPSYSEFAIPIVLLERR